MTTQTSHVWSYIIYTVGGLIVGSCLAITGTMSTLYAAQMPTTWEAIVAVQQNRPALWILDAMPVIAGFLGYAFSRIQARGGGGNTHALRSAYAAVTEDSRKLMERHRRLKSKSMRTNQLVEESVQARDSAKNESRFWRAAMGAFLDEFHSVAHARRKANATVSSDNTQPFQNIVQLLRQFYAIEFDEVTANSSTVFIDSLADRIQREFPTEPGNLKVSIRISPQCPEQFQVDTDQFLFLVRQTAEHLRETCNVDHIQLEFAPAETTTGIRVCLHANVANYQPAQSETPVLQFTKNSQGNEVLGNIHWHTAEKICETMGTNLKIARTQTNRITVWWTITVADPKVQLETASQLQNTHVIIGMDCNFTRTGIAHALETRAATVDIGLDGESVLDCAITAAQRGQAADLIIVDFGPLEADLLERLNAIPETRHTKILSLPSHAKPRGQTDLERTYTPGSQAQLFEQIAMILTDKATRKRPSDALEFAPLSLNSDEMSHRNSKTPKILIVDDDLVTLNITRGLLDRLGFHYSTAQNGREALDALKHQTYAAILMDCVMPVMDGYATTAAIRIMEKETKHIPIVGMTASDLPRDHQRCLDAGMDLYLTKPISQTAIQRVLQHLLQPAHKRPNNQNNSAPDVDITLVNPRIIQNLRAGLDTERHDLVSNIIDLYVRDLTAHIESLTQALRRDNLEEFAERAQRLQSSSAQLGAIRLARRCSDIARATKTVPRETLENLLTQLSKDAQLTQAELLFYRTHSRITQSG